jgi:HAE1 family hydrophobic/amphiphilic exporter-1
LPEKAVVKALGVSGRDSSLIVRVTEQDKGFIRMTLAPGVDADEFISFLQSMTDTLAGEEMVFTIQKDPSPIEDVLRLSSNGNELRISFRDEGKAAEISQQIIERIVRTSELWPEQVRGLQNKTVFSLSLDEDFIKQEAISLSQAERSVLSALSGSTALTAVGSIHVQHQDADTYPDVESIPLHFNERVYRLGSLASITPDTAETEIIRYNGRRTVYLSYKNTPSAQAKIIDVTKMIAPQLTNLARLEIAGEEEERRSAFNNLITAFVLAFCLVYMIIAAQLESLFFPLMIMLSVPMASMGAILLFALTGTSINIMSLIGFTVALGIVINDSIILTTTMLLMRKEKSGSLNPAIEAGERRFRPIIITTLTTVVGMFPMALGGGAGANIRSPLAVAVIGGLLTATLLTLLWQPLLYSVILKRRPRT